MNSGEKNDFHFYIFERMPKEKIKWNNNLEKNVLSAV